MLCIYRIDAMRSELVGIDSSDRSGLFWGWRDLELKALISLTNLPFDYVADAQTFVP